MDAFELNNERQKPTGIWACEKCRRLTLGGNGLTNTRESAEKCCTRPACEICNATTNGQHYSLCSACQQHKNRLDRQERNANRLAAAEDVTDTYDGVVCTEEYGTGDMGGDGYYTSAEAILEYANDEDGLYPEWAFACSTEHREIDLGRIIEDVCIDGYEEMPDHLNVPQSLLDGIDEFNLVNKTALTVYNVDYSRKVKVQ